MYKQSQCRQTSQLAHLCVLAEQQLTASYKVCISSQVKRMHACFQQAFKQSSCEYLVKHIQLASGEEGLQPMKWGAYLLVASKESEVQLLYITTCTSTCPLVQSHKFEVSGKKYCRAWYCCTTNGSQLHNECSNKHDAAEKLYTG